MIYETIQDFPTDIGQTDVTLRAVNIVGAQESPYSFAREVQVFPGARWEIEINFLPVVRAEAQRFEAFLLSLRGRAGRLRLADPYRSLPLGSNLGSPIVAAGESGAELLQSRGWAISRTGLLKAGDFIELDMHLHQVLRDVSSDATGAADIYVWPPLRDQALEGTPIITKNARGVFALDSNSIEFSRTTDGLNAVTMRAVEVIQMRVIPEISTFAILGDSLGEYNCGDITSGGYRLQYLNSRGYAAQAQALLANKIDFVPWTAGGRIPYAIGGYMTQRIKDELLAPALASNAEGIIWMCGTNDWLYGDDATYLSTWLSLIRSIALAIQAAGKQSIFVELPPTLSIFAPGPARIAAMWAAAPAVLADTGTVYCRSHPQLELTPGARNGIANPAHFEGGGVHWIDSGANLQGHALADVLDTRFILRGNPFAAGTWINVTPNPNLTPNPTQTYRPDHWFDPTWAAGSTHSEAMHDFGDGTFGYEITYDQGTATSESYVFVLENTSGAAVASKVCDLIIEVEVLSGSFSRLTADLFAYVGGAPSSIAQDLYSTRTSGTPAIFTPTEGKFVLRTPKVSSASGVTMLVPILRIVGAGVLRITKMMVRTY